MNRRKLTLSLMAGSLGSGLISGCATTEDGTKIPFAPLDQILKGRAKAKTEALAEQERVAGLSITHPDRQAEFDELWTDVTKHTTAVAMSDNRVRISSKGTLFRGADISEQNFFIRAAAETLRRDKDGFVIKQIDFFSEGTPWASLGSNFNLSSRNWIGNYEDFRANRNEQNIFSNQRRMRNKAMDGVILLLNKSEFPNRDRFTASEIYLNLIDFKSNSL